MCLAGLAQLIIPYSSRSRRRFQISCSRSLLVRMISNRRVSLSDRTAAWASNPGMTHHAIEKVRSIGSLLLGAVLRYKAGVSESGTYR